jgi:hypothetical protein
VLDSILLHILCIRAAIELDPEEDSTINMATRNHGGVGYCDDLGEFLLDER